MKQKVAPNLPHLQAALNQYGPWQDQALTPDTVWLTSALAEKIAGIDWIRAAQDVERFLDTAERQSLRLWSERFFSSRLDNLMETMMASRTT